ncbi:UbiD family decarboxylase [Brevibacillus nitrificans]|uniref:UbiD family decarboxylase n=1 Tax=Brevibacillus nitrificans TaxID=651560 RepID=UPI0016066888|nr:UbiD family decarboxylase [Brevibacillus nitrificans]
MDLRDYISKLETELPDQLLRIKKEVNPAEFEATAILQHLENNDQYPTVIFENNVNVNGDKSEFSSIINVFASRERCALAMNMDVSAKDLPLSLEYAAREKTMIEPTVISREEAPVKQTVKIEDEVDLSEYPIIRFHEMDPAPYLDVTAFVKDPDGGFYNGAFQRTMYKGKRKLGLHMSPRHNWQIARKYEERNEPTPIIIVVGHHPSFYLGSLNVSPFGNDDYAKIGSIMGESLRLVPSETWGDQFMVPADAEMIIEGEIVPNHREVEGPFGEFPGTYGPQRVRWVINVRAVTHRKDAIFQSIFTGHRETWILGAIPKEGTLFNRIKGVVPTTRSVHLPLSSVGRFHCYISIDKKVDGESKQAALIALGECDFVKHVVVVDSDIDPFKEEQVMWAMATRVQADHDVDIIKNVKGNTLDPSQLDDIMGAKMIIDATKPVSRLFSQRIKVPDSVMNRISLQHFLEE